MCGVRSGLGLLKPDNARSGLLVQAERPDPKEAPVAESVPRPTTEAEESESSSSSSESEESIDVHEERAAVASDVVVAASQWEPDVKMYQHLRSSIVHSVACGTTHDRFSCGNQLTNDYRQVREVQFLDFRKCKRCAAARPIKDVGAMASAFQKQRLEKENARKINGSFFLLGHCCSSLTLVS